MRKELRVLRKYSHGYNTAISASGASAQFWAGWPLQHAAGIHGKVGRYVVIHEDATAAWDLCGTVSPMISKGGSGSLID
jgi:hypothetical protein